MRQFLALFGLVVVGCRAPDNGQACDDSTVLPADDSAATDDSAEPELVVAGVFWTLDEVPAWDPNMVERVAKDSDLIYCLRLSEHGVLERWDSDGGVRIGEYAGSWTEQGPAQYELSWFDTSNDDVDTTTPQTWTWTSPTLALTEGSFPMDAIPLHEGCPFTPAED